jgi:hypothetical protein
MDDAKAKVVGEVSNAVLGAMREYLLSSGDPEEGFDPTLVPTGIIHGLMVMLATGATDLDAFEALLKVMRGMLSMERDDARHFFTQINSVKGMPA